MGPSLKIGRQIRCILCTTIHGMKLSGTLANYEDIVTTHVEHTHKDDDLHSPQVKD